MDTINLKLFKLSNNVQNRKTYSSLCPSSQFWSPHKPVEIRQRTRLSYLYISWIIFYKLIWPLVPSPDAPEWGCTLFLLSIAVHMNFIEFHENTRPFQSSLTLLKLFLLPRIFFWCLLRVKNRMQLWVEVRSGMGVQIMFSINYIEPESQTLQICTHLT